MSPFRPTRAVLAAAVALALSAPLALTASLSYAATPPAAAAAEAAVPAASDVATQRALLKLADQYYDANARYEPLNATENGDSRFDDQLGLSIAPAQRARQFKLYRQFSQRLQQIPRERLNHTDRVSYDILAYELQGL